MRKSTRSRLGQLPALVAILTCSSISAVAQDQAPTQAKPATAAKKASIYDQTADASAQIEKATAAARRENKRILVMFGGDWCGWCHKLHELFASNAEIRKILSYEYVLVMVDTKAPNAAELMDKCKAALTQEDQQKAFGVPFLGVLDSDGKVVTAQRTDPLEEGDHHHPGRVKEFLNRWAVTPKDAEVVLREGLSGAASEDKRVFLTFGAPWCGWCHQLEGWLAKPEIASILDRDFVIVKIDIDRMTHGKDVMGRVRTKSDGGIPWFAVLDPQGKALGTSDAPKGNIGYPFAPEEIDAFMALITGQSRRIEPGQHDRLRKSLTEAADRITKERKARQAATPPVAAR